MALDGFEIRAAALLDLPYVMSLMRANRESVGGLPKPAVEERLERRTLALGLLNGEPCGYLMFDVRGGEIRIPQACIQYDARRKAYGVALVDWLVANYKPDEIRIRCAADIEANLFWRELGFVCTGVVRGGSRRGRLINIWERWLTPRLLVPEDVAVLPAAQVRVDTMYDDTAFIREQPEGFRPVEELPKLAWANRKS